MRLLCSRDGVFKIREFYSDIPPYAILSHTWGADEDEVTFTDIMDSAAPRLHKPGFKKLKFCAEQAAKFDVEYFWIDTCCIDKSSSTELSEAINSMYRWYRDAAYCFVYLADVFKDGCAPENMSWRLGEEIIESELPVLSEDVFRESRWFTRGWTLQELLAPLHSDRVRFYTSESLYLGDRIRLSNLISAVTGIPVEALAGGGLREYSISDRLKWARNRLTKREEDGAYSLLGLFDVHMPLIYGEGRENAMFRLLQECQANERRIFGFYRPLLPLRRYLLASISDTWSIWMLLYGMIFFAVFCAVIAQDHGPILALYVVSKIMAIARMQITRKISRLGLKVLELSMSLVTRIVDLLAVVFFESSTIMLVVAGTYVLWSSIVHALTKAAKSPHVSSDLNEPQLRRDETKRLLVLSVLVFLDSPSIWRVVAGMCAIFAYMYHSERIPRWLQRW